MATSGYLSWPPVGTFSWPRTQNGHCESFNDKLRDELLNLEIFDSMWEVRTMLQDRRHSYNHYRPHSSLSYLTPVEFSNKWHEENALLLSQEVDR